MRSPLILSLAVALLAETDTAQVLYSPAYRASSEANYDNSLPWGFGAATQSFLQVHPDLEGRPGTFTRMSLRRDGVVVSDPSYTAKTVTADLFFGGGVPVASLSATFASDFVTVRTQVAAGRTYNVPDWTIQPASPPAAFDLLCPLDAPFVWDGLNPFAWEMRVHGMSATQPMFTDAERTPTGANTTTVYGTTGCIATGQSFAYVTQGAFQSFDGAGPIQSFTWSCLRGVASAPTAILLGAQDANIAFPGLCSNLLVTPFVTINGSADVNGAFSLLSQTPYNASNVGLELYWQCACADLARADALKVAVSNARHSSLGGLPRLACARVYEAASDTAAVGFLDPSNIRLGSVIRLD